MYDEERYESENKSFENEENAYIEEPVNKEASHIEEPVTEEPVYIEEPAVEEKRTRAPYEPIKDTYYKETVKEPKKKGGFKRFILACAVVSLFGGLGIGGGYSLVQSMSDKNEEVPLPHETVAPAEEKKTTPTTSFVGTAANDAVAVIDAVYPAVVNITTNVHTTANYYGWAVPYDSEGAGSGVIFNEDDTYVYMVTNNHVVEDATGVSVSITGEETIAATVVGTDASADIAVIKALRTDFEEANVAYKIASFADSDELKVGQSVIAIGNALGEGKSATGGMVSVLNKVIEVGGQALEVIQTSSPINPGNSGGALVDYNGEIIGINTAKTSTTVAEGMGYAIPSNTAKEVMERLLVDGTTPKPYLGIMGSDITDDISNLYKLPIGVLVREVLDGGAAEKAGVKVGDVITSFNDMTVMNMEGLQEALKNSEIGSTVEMNIIRNGKEAKTLKVTVLDANS